MSKVKLSNSVKVLSVVLILHKLEQVCSESRVMSIKDANIVANCTYPDQNTPHFYELSDLGGSTPFGQAFLSKN